MRRVLVALVVIASAAFPAAQSGSQTGPPIPTRAGGTPPSTARFTFEQLELAADHLQWDRWYPPADLQTSPSVDANVLAVALGTEGATDGAVKFRAYAVRALGRLQNPKDVTTIAQMLGDPSAVVRQAAASAIAQCLWLETEESSDVRGARLRLEGRITQETDFAAKQAMYEALGSLIYRTQYDLTHAAMLLGATGGMNLPGLEALTRRHPGITLDGRTVTFLRQLAVGRSQPPEIVALRVLQNIRDDDAATIKAAASWRCRGASAVDCGVEFRVIGVQMMNALDKQFAEEFTRALQDEAWPVRYEALTKAAQLIATTRTCAPLIDALDDQVDLIVRHAVELFSPACPERDDLTVRLAAWAGKLASAMNDAEWQLPATALETLVKFDPDAAHKIAKDIAATHQMWQVRVVAARIAGTLFDEDLALSLARPDPTAVQSVIQPNVRTAGLKALRKMNSTQLADAAIDALADPDDELLFTAASLLKDSGRHEAVQPLIDALMRLSKKMSAIGGRQAGRQTSAPTPLQMATLASARDSSRDARISILMALQNLAEPADGLPSLLRNLLSDTDPIVASTTADVIGRFVAKRPIPKPTKYAPIQPSEADIVNRPRCARMLLENGAQIDLTMDMANAPIASARFLMLASDKFYDGLTFHRVEPNSFVQAGSPDANELSNGDRFIRDEIAAPVLANRLAFVSRGPDTAAGQFFVTQMDLPMFDHQFTVFATVGPSLQQLLQDGKIAEGTKITSIRGGACPAK